jgi:DNA-binding CsgD family transcriptional regulator
MSNVKERVGGSVELHHRQDDHFVKFIRAVIAVRAVSSEDEPEAAETLPPEQVLFDIDVDGSRYMLIRSISVERCTPSLSPREWEIVRMVAQGRPNKVIAAVLNISSWTVCTHLRRIFAKLGVTSRAAMIAKVATDIEGAIDLKEAVGNVMSRRQSQVPSGRATTSQSAATGAGPAWATPTTDAASAR